MRWINRPQHHHHHHEAWHEWPHFWTSWCCLSKSCQYMSAFLPGSNHNILYIYQHHLAWIAPHGHTSLNWYTTSSADDGNHGNNKFKIKDRFVPKCHPSCCNKYLLWYLTVISFIHTTKKFGMWSQIQIEWNQNINHFVLPCTFCVQLHFHNMWYWPIQ